MPGYGPSLPSSMPPPPQLPAHGYAPLLRSGVPPSQQGANVQTGALPPPPLQRQQRPALGLGQPLRVERNPQGGAAVIIEGIPGHLLRMEVLNSHLKTFGSIGSLQINSSRREAIVTFSRAEDAEEALCHPVLGDPHIVLRPHRTRMLAHKPAPALRPTSLDAPLPAPAPAAAKAATTVPAAATADGAAGAAAGGHRANPKLEQALEKRKQREEIEARRRVLLQNLTDQLRAVLAKISDSKTNEKDREQLQTIAATIKDQITAQTPKASAPPQPLQVVRPRPHHLQRLRWRALIHIGRGRRKEKGNIR
eukprot:NODE_15384_length_1053_cov_1.305616.p1 GENE.NODE_15384_length_1053_cov_1.305616~~NODE_15384_length_1053_cov_1.305616.p1  ORF type:complete len:340 (+),score=111.56 NODE_15384_length_1053_cov_1.305616:99-1022(+)